MLQIANLSMTLSKNTQVLLEDFSFSLNKGDRAVIIGEEGNGKSTFLKLIYDEKLVDDYVSWNGTIAKKGLKLGYLPQELPAEEQVMTVYDYFESRQVYELKSAAELAELAGEVKFPIDMLYSPQLTDSLSGGEKVKMQLIRILAEEPDILLLDEPSNDIDIYTLMWLENFILSCSQPLMFISHDETLIEKTANVIIHFEQLRRKTAARCTVSRMSYSEYVGRRGSALEQQEKVARKEQAEYEKQQERWNQIYNKVEGKQASISRADPHGGRLLKKKMKAVKSQGRRMEREKESMTQMPDVEEAIFARFPAESLVPNSKDIIRLRLPELKIEDKILSRNIELNVIGPEHIGIIGRNGAGKSTLLKIIADELLNRRDISAAYMPQRYEDKLNMNITPVEFLFGNENKEKLTRARTFLGSMKYTHDEMTGKISELSGGQKAKLLFINMVLSGSNVLILDEPTRNFSPLSNPVIRSALHSFGGCIISVTHDRKYLAEVCGKVYELKPDGLFEMDNIEDESQ